MKSNTALARKEVKALIIRKGMSNILCGDLAEIHDRTGLGACDIQNALSYFQYSPTQFEFRTQHA